MWPRMIVASGHAAAAWATAYGVVSGSSPQWKSVGALCSAAARISRSVSSPAGGRGLLDRLAGGDLVPPRRLRERPVDAAAVPAGDALRPDPDEHARQVERRLEIVHALRAEVAKHHPPRELDPVALDELGAAAHHHALVGRLRVVDAERDAGVAAHVAAEAGELLGHEPEALAVVLVPRRVHVRPAVLADRTDLDEDPRLREELVQLLRRHSAALPEPEPTRHEAPSSPARRPRRPPSAGPASRDSPPARAYRPETARARRAARAR